MDNPFKERLTTFLDFDQKQTLLERKYNLKRLITLLWVFRHKDPSEELRPDPSQPYFLKSPSQVNPCLLDFGLSLPCYNKETYKNFTN